MADREDWAVVELMGHVRLAGKLSEEERFGGKLGRLDIPTPEGFITQFFASSSVYRITIVSEAVARHVAATSSAAPVSPWDFPKQLTQAVSRAADEDDGPDCDPDDEEPEDFVDTNRY